ncbi:MAG: TIGR04563 family protein [Myxococcota bacterium]
MATPSKKKRSLYIPENLLAEMQLEASRQDRSLSWMVQQAWKIAREDIKKLPSVTDVFEVKDRARLSGLQL